MGTVSAPALTAVLRSVGSPTLQGDAAIWPDAFAVDSDPWLTGSDPVAQHRSVPGVILEDAA